MLHRAAPHRVTSAAARGGRAPAAAARTGSSLALSVDPYRILTGLLIVVAISRAHQHFGFLAPLRPALLLVVATAAYAFLNRRYISLAGLKTTTAKWIGGLGLMACASVPLSISVGASGMFIISDYSKTLLLAAILIVAIRHVRDLYTLVWAFVCAAGILAFLTLFVFRMRVSGGVARIAGGYTYDANDIACVAVVSIPIALWLLQGVKGRLKLVPLAVIMGLGMTLAKTGSRGGFVGLLAIGLAMLVMLRQVRLDKRLAFVAVVGLGLAVAAPQGYWEQIRSITKPTEDYNWSAPAGRKAVLMRGLGYTMRNPATGIGIGTFGRAEGMISDRALEYQPGMAGIKWSAAHNSFLQVVAEMGIPGLLLFGGLVFGSVRGLNRLRRALPRDWIRRDGEQRFLYLGTLYLPISMIGFAVAGFFVSFAYVDLVYVVAAFVAGTHVCVRAQLRGSSPVLQPPVPRRRSPGHPPAP